MLVAVIVAANLDGTRRHGNEIPFPLKPTMHSVIPDLDESRASYLVTLWRDNGLYESIPGRTDVVKFTPPEWVADAAEAYAARVSADEPNGDGVQPGLQPEAARDGSSTAAALTGKEPMHNSALSWLDEQAASAEQRRQAIVIARDLIKEDPHLARLVSQYLHEALNAAEE